LQYLTILAALPFPNIDPVAIWLGPVPVRWYGLAYAAGLLLGWQYVRMLMKSERLWGGAPPLTLDQVDSLLLWVTAGVVVGGRLGILLYEPQLLWQDPLQILQPWKGGMSFHGGAIGVILMLLLFGRRHGISPFRAGDAVAAAIPIGLFFGRLANFVNGELWGRASNVSWAMVFPDPQAGGVARHPSQLYEAALEGLALFLVLRYLTHHLGKLQQPGYVAGACLAGYAIARSFCEIFRDGDPFWLDPSGTLTLGIVYSLPMLVAGIWMIRRQTRASSTASS
jgi:phosphatidylglycerol---prolipoprotein diacylglyceryl transferase